MMSEKLLDTVERAMSGDESAFEQLYRIKARDILYISMSLLEEGQEGEDAAQEIIAYMHEHIGDLQEAKAFHIWLYRIINGVCANMRRKEKKRFTDLDGMDNKELETDDEFLTRDYLENQVKRRQLLHAVKTLPYYCRVCIFMFYYDRMSYRDIGKALRMTGKDVDNILMKSKKLIRRSLDEQSLVSEREVKADAIGIVPVLTQVLWEEAQKTISGDLIERSLQAGKTLIAARIADGSGGAAASGTVTQTGGIAGKITMGMLLATGAAVLGSVAFYNNSNDGVVHTSSSVELEQQEVSQNLTQFTEAEEEYEINTLEDMIGTLEAEQLRSYADSGSGDKNEILNFLLEVGLDNGQSIWKQEAQEEDTLFVRSTQRRQLVVITRYDIQGGWMELKFRFYEEEQEVPQYMDIPGVFDRW